MNHPVHRLTTVLAMIFMAAACTSQSTATPDPRPTPKVLASTPVKTMVEVPKASVWQGLMALSATGDVLAVVSQTSKVRLFDTATGKMTHSIGALDPALQPQAMAIAAARKREAIAVSYSQDERSPHKHNRSPAIRLFDLTSGRKITTLDRGWLHARDLCFTKGDTLFTASRGMETWTPFEGHFTDWQQAWRPDESFERIFVSADGKRAAALHYEVSGVAHSTDPDTGDRVYEDPVALPRALTIWRKIQGKGQDIAAPSEIVAGSMSTDGAVLVLAGRHNSMGGLPQGQGVWILDMNAPRIQWRFVALDARPVALHAPNNAPGLALVSDVKGAVHAIDTEAASIRGTLEAMGEQVVTAIVTSANGERLAMGGGQSTRVWHWPSVRDTLKPD